MSLSIPSSVLSIGSQTESEPPSLSALPSSFLCGKLTLKHESTRAVCRGCFGPGRCSSSALLNTTVIRDSLASTPVESSGVPRDRLCQRSFPPDRRDARKETRFPIVYLGKKPTQGLVFLAGSVLSATTTDDPPPFSLPSTHNWDQRESEMGSVI